MSKQGYFGFTLDVRTLANILAQDPSTREEMIAGINDAVAAPAPLTSSVGGANLTPGPDKPTTFCSIFAATVQGKDSGDVGLFYRNDTHGGRGNRIQMRIRRQPAELRKDIATNKVKITNDEQAIAFLKTVAQKGINRG